MHMHDELLVCMTHVTYLEDLIPNFKCIIATGLVVFIKWAQRKFPCIRGIAQHASSETKRERVYETKLSKSHAVDWILKIRNRK